MDDMEQGRARGRARGRGRARAAKEDVPRGPIQQRPGATAEVKAPPAAYPAMPGSAQARGEPVIAVPGRGVQRGALQSGASGMGESRMAALSLTEGPYLMGRRDYYDPALFEPNTRPKHFKDKKDASGRPLMLQTNYFPLACVRNWVLYQYRVDFQPEVDHRGARKGLLKDHKGLLGIYVFDGTMLFTTRRMKEKVTEVFSVSRRTDEKVKVILQMTNELQPNDPVSIQIYNIIFRWILEKIGMEQIGRNYYNPSMGFTVDTNRCTFELWPGFITSILNYEQNTMLCAEISHKLMRKDTVLKILMQMFQDAKRSGKNFQEEATKFLLGQIVLTRYNNNTYRIDDINWNLKVSDTFQRRGEAISYVQYYKEAYNVDIRDTRQPMLISRPKKREIRKGGIEEIHLVPELCTVTGLTDDLRADFQTMKKLAEHTKQGPRKRVEALKRFISKINSEKEVQERLKNWGLEFKSDLQTVQGRVLPDEAIIFDGNRIAQAGPQANWDREFRNQKLFKCVDLKDWVFIHTKRDSSVANDLMNNLNKTGRPMGFNLARPQVMALESDRISDIQNALKSYVNQNRSTAQIVVCMLPSNRKDRYDAIKKLCCVDLAIPSQVVLSKTVANPKRAMSVATKIAIQMNCKLGGEAWAVKIPLKSTMLVGIDTYHDSSQKGRSVGGFCATMNANYTKWYSNVTFQTTGTELSDGIKRCLTGALSRYKQLNGQLPERIIVFRDGVGDGQLEMVKGYEIKQMWSCFKEAGFTKKPAFSFIVVKKRVNARFFAQGGREGLSNPPPGTIVDDVVTKKEWFDFYIVPQSVREGTVTPTHFNVIEDEPSSYMQLKPGHFQKLAYKLCHLYYNWPGTIRVPAPCMYAHKLAFLVGQSVHQQVSEKLSDRLYFL